MFRNITIRTARTITIAGYTAALMLVIATSIAGLETANTALDRMYNWLRISSLIGRSMVVRACEQ
ncbi:hypothetical protein SAMN05446635_0008 [Burkholderia sp. OK233]|nr:hypothetical protein SAMN05446635_0008 [Burkholderia sp. OK233]